MRAQSVEPLSTFLDFLTVEYMIENVMLLLRGTLSGRNVSELMAQCHPLGMFRESTMRNIPSFDANARGYAELYETVLVDTPVGKYFQTYLDEKMQQRLGQAGDMKNILEETQIEILRNELMKLYLEDFYTFCQGLGGDSAEIMCGLLNSRADRNAINITLNSFGTPLNDPTMRDGARRRLYPSIGHLYPAGTELLIKVDEESKLVEALRSFPEYHAIVERALSTGSSEGNIDDDFRRMEVKLSEMAFEGQMHFAVFYAWLRLKEQEVRNLVWISECILQRRKDKIAGYIPIFAKSSDWRCESTRRLG
jgi:V-type H+-transporting ATPase subunit d